MAHDSPLPIITLPNSGRTIALVGDVYRFVATGDQTAGRYALVEATVPPGSGPPPHTHSREQEGFYVLEGQITFYKGEEPVVAGPGTFVNMPPGCRHHFRNESSSTARMLIWVAPAGLELMFLDAGVEIRPGETAPKPTEADVARLLACVSRYGIEIHGP
jgi:quercetin dioxygenase-like cupin family protein